MQEVVQHGTAVAASGLKLPLAGKTGTTNDFTDAWFVGFSPTLTCGVWIGYDEKRTLGAKESGAHAALPMWIEFMKTALAGKDPGTFQNPLKTKCIEKSVVGRCPKAPQLEGQRKFVSG